MTANLFASFLTLLCSSAIALPQYVPGQLIVKFKSEAVSMPAGKVSASAAETSINIPSIKELLNSQKLQSVKRVFGNYPQTIAGVRSMSSAPPPDLANVYKFTFSKDTDIPALAGKFGRDQSVEYAEPNYIRKLFAPNDPYCVNYPSNPNQWGVFKTQLISSESGMSAWDLCAGTPSVEIAIIDTGVDWTHPDLVANVNTVEGWNFVSVSTAELTSGYGLVPYPGEDYSGPNANFKDAEGHGTHCSGIACAVTNNGTGIAGAGWHCKIMPIKAGFAAYDPKYTPSEEVGVLADDDSSNAVIYAADHGAKVLSMSWGGSASSLIHDAIYHAMSKGCVLVAAAGNESTQSITDAYPGAYPGVLAVAATDVDDSISWYSNYGTWVGISAPGGDATGGSPGRIWSTYPVAYGSYTWMSGTSMATPLVAGIAALVRSKYPALSSLEVIARIKNGADNIDAENPSYIGKMGAGRINAFRALAEQNPPLVQVQSPEAGDFFRGGDPVEVRFTATDESGVKANSLSIDYSVDGGTTFPYAVTSEAPVSSPFSWTWPRNVSSSSVKIKVKVRDIYNTEGYGESGTFSVVSTRPAVSIIYPAGGENITAESALRIRYTAIAETGLSAHPISIYYSTGDAYQMITGDAAYIPGTIESYDWTAPLLESSAARVKVTATDIYGLVGSVETPYFTIFETEAQKDKTPPVLTLRIVNADGSLRTIWNGDYIPPRPTFKLTVTDAHGVDTLNVRLYLDGVAVSAPVMIASSLECYLTYSVPSDLDPESVRSHSLKADAKDIGKNIATAEVTGLKVTGGAAKLSGPVLVDPPVAVPSRSVYSNIAYDLTSDADISIFVMGMDGQIVWTRKFRSGEAGGRAGYDQVAFDGRSDLNGGWLGNGIYVFRIVSGGSVIGSGHLVISD
ncbi:MAG TPA: S8 family serine peptidase [Candidatus Omnitrophota bacterium]|nr:S8 family serine peptidase [Candidatus Omnitrophota bacterium]